MRKRRGRTQDDVAATMNMKRSTLSGYENEVAHPGLDMLMRFSDYFNIAIDTLIKVDLQKLSESQLRQIERGFDVYVKGASLRVLTTTIGNDNVENIELVPEKAKAGYANGFADPEYIRVLPAFRLPFLSKEKKYRTFQISGDSMLPIQNGDWVTGVFIQDWTALRDKEACVILTADEGIVFKIVENRLLSEHKLVLHSLNPLYPPFELAANGIREIWQFVHYISSSIPVNSAAENYHLVETIKQLKQDVHIIQTKLNL